MEKLPLLPSIKRTLCLLCFITVVIWISAIVSPSAASESAIQISISNDGFTPKVSTITAGTTVVWTNSLDVPVSLNSKAAYQIFLPLVTNGQAQSVAGHDRAGENHSGETYTTQADWLTKQTLAPGETFTYTFVTAGEYPIYATSDHADAGVVYVSSAPSATTEPTDSGIRVSLVTDTADGFDFQFLLNDKAFKLDLAIPSDNDQVNQAEHFTELEPGQYTLMLDQLQPFVNHQIVCNSTEADPVIQIVGRTVQIELGEREQIACEYQLLKDSDYDRLADVYETNDGNFISETATGTDPHNADTDEDGINDGDEVLGTVGGLDLPSFGSNPLRRTILIEYDWVDDSLQNRGHCQNGADGFHSHRPTAATIRQTQQMYAHAPTLNPDGSFGIDLIQDYGQGGVFTGGNRIAKNGTGLISGSVYGSEFRSLKAQNFAPNRRNYFHYTILSHQHGSPTNFSSGNSEINGNDFIVSMYNYHCADVLVGNTIVHELGHNLGLLHGGGDHINNKPNYNSVMNYRFQFAGIDSDTSCDGQGDGISGYSTGGRIPLDENNLNESQGVCGAGHAGIDWNKDGDMVDAGMSENLNADTLIGVLHDHNDWDNLYFLGILSEGTGGRAAAHADLRPVEFSTELAIPDFGQGAKIPIMRTNSVRPY